LSPQCQEGQDRNGGGRLQIEGGRLSDKKEKAMMGKKIRRNGSEVDFQIRKKRLLCPGTSLLSNIADRSERMKMNDVWREQRGRKRFSASLYTHLGGKREKRKGGGIFAILRAKRKAINSFRLGTLACRRSPGRKR